MLSQETLIISLDIIFFKQEPRFYNLKLLFFSAIEIPQSHRKNCLFRLSCTQSNHSQIERSLFTYQTGGQTFLSLIWLSSAREREREMEREIKKESESDREGERKTGRFGKCLIAVVSSSSKGYRQMRETLEALPECFTNTHKQFSRHDHRLASAYSVLQQPMTVGVSLTKTGSLSATVLWKWQIRMCGWIKTQKAYRRGLLTGTWPRLWQTEGGFKARGPSNPPTLPGPGPHSPAYSLIFCPLCLAQTCSSPGLCKLLCSDWLHRPPTHSRIEQNSLCQTSGSFNSL